jgi:hypothetical protein
VFPPEKFYVAEFFEIGALPSLVSWGGVRLSPLGTSATNWPIVPAQDDRWWVWSSRWNENCQEKPKYTEKTYPSATLSTTNPTWPDLGSNRGRRGGKPATNRLSYGTAVPCLNRNIKLHLKMCAWPISVLCHFHWHFSWPGEYTCNLCFIQKISWSAQKAIW